MLLLAAAVRGTLGVPVHPGDPQPRLASRHPPARVLSRGRKGQEAHAVQPHPLAPPVSLRASRPCSRAEPSFRPPEAGGLHSKLLKRARYAPQLPTLPKLPAAAEGVVPRAPEFPEYPRPTSYLAKRGVQVEYEWAGARYRPKTIPLAFQPCADPRAG